MHVLDVSSSALLRQRNWRLSLQSVSFGLDLEALWNESEISCDTNKKVLIRYLASKKTLKFSTDIDFSDFLRRTKYE